MRELTADGKLVVVTHRHPHGELLSGGPDRTGIYDRQGLTDLGRLPKGANKAPRQTADGVARGSITAWLDTSSTELGSGDWRVYAHDRKVGRTHVLGDSDDDVEGTLNPWPPGMAHLTIGARYVAWAIARPAKDERPGFRSDIVARSPDGSGPLRTLVRHAMMPVFLGADLYYARSEDVDSAMPKSRYEIRRLRSDGTDELVVGGNLGKHQMISKLAVSAHRLAWVIGTTDKERATLYVRDATGSTTAFALQDASYPTSDLSVSDSLLAWANGSGNGDTGEYVFDFHRNRLWRVNPGFRGFSSAMVAGKYVAWSVLHDDSAYPRYVVARLR